MKILHLSDLHLNRAWLAWAQEQAAQYDLVCVSGDLLDMFSRQGHFWGVLVIKRWAESFPGNLALCSGNHDGSSPEQIPDTGLLPILTAEDRREAEKLLLLERWMDALERPSVVTDNRTRLVETDSPRRGSRQRSGNRLHRESWLSFGATLLPIAEKHSSLWRLPRNVRLRQTITTCPTKSALSLRRPTSSRKISPALQPKAGSL